jgi:ribosomal protein S11
MRSRASIEKNKKFRLGSNINKRKAYINMRKNHSNFFLTLTDCIGKVIISKSAAMVLGKLERRRRRKSPQTIEAMVASLEKYLQFYKIKFINVVLHIRPGHYITNLSRSLKVRKISILNIWYRRRLPYSSTRGRRKNIKIYV